MGLQILHDVHSEALEEREDIVYVSMARMARMACAGRYFECDTDAFRPIIALESIIVLGGNAVVVLKGESERIGTAIHPNA